LQVFQYCLDNLLVAQEPLDVFKKEGKWAGIGSDVNDCTEHVGTNVG
jgi:hypothetical protein